MKAVRQKIAKILRFPSDLVLDGNYSNKIDKKTRFITVTPLDVKSFNETRRFDGQREIETVTMSKQHTVSISVYGDGAFDYANYLEACLCTTIALQEFKSINCSIVSIGDVRDINQVVGGGYEQRGQFDIIFGSEYVVEYQLNHIEHVDVNVIEDP